jgi:serine/threonine-protein kinase 11
MAVLVRPNRLIADHVIPDNSKPKRIKKINQYALVEKLGAGSTSKVFLALDTSTDRPFAAKAVPVGGASHDGLGLQREIRMLRRFMHPNIVKLHEVLHSAKEHMAYLILEWASFGSLDGVVLAPQVLASVFLQVCQGLSYLHSQGIVHHDIKPSNILLFEGGIAKLSDLGIGHTFASADFVVGSPAYQAPEFFDDDDDAILDPVKEDVWSLGVTLFEVAFGYLPFQGENMYEISHRVKTSRLTIPSTAPPELADLLIKMLDVNPTSRLNLNEVIEHYFFAGSRPACVLPMIPHAEPKISSSRSLVPIPALICDENYTFSCAQRSQSWPGVTTLTCM